MAQYATPQLLSAMRAVLGPDVPEMTLIRSLHIARGNVDKAVSIHFDFLEVEKITLEHLKPRRSPAHLALPAPPPRTPPAPVPPLPLPALPAPPPSAPPSVPSTRPVIHLYDDVEDVKPQVHLPPVGVADTHSLQGTGPPISVGAREMLPSSPCGISDYATATADVARAGEQACNAVEPELLNGPIDAAQCAGSRRDAGGKRNHLAETVSGEQLPRQPGTCAADENEDGERRKGSPDKASAATPRICWRGLEEGEEAQEAAVCEAGAGNRCTAVGRKDDGCVQHVSESQLPAVMMDVTSGGAILRSEADSEASQQAQGDEPGVGGEAVRSSGEGRERGEGMRGVNCTEREGEDEMEGRVDDKAAGNEEEAEGRKEDSWHSCEEGDVAGNDENDRGVGEGDGSDGTSDKEEGSQRGHCDTEGVVVERRGGGGGG